MSWSSDFRELRTIADWATAKQRYDSVKPIRDSENLRPLEKRCKQHAQIRELPNGDIACRLHYTNVVTYHKDATLTVRRYDSRSTIEFAVRLVPPGLAVFGHMGMLAVRMTAEDHSLLRFLEGPEPLTFAPLMRGTWKLLSKPAVQKRRYINRSKAAMVRSQLAPFVRFVKVCDALAPGVGRDNNSWFENGVPAVRHLPIPEDRFHELLCRLHLENWQSKLYHQAYKSFQCIDTEILPYGVLASRSKW